MSKFGSRIRELRIHLCQTGVSSKGVREFIEQQYVSVKKSNPKFPILIRECSGAQPRVWARYEKGVEECASLDNLGATEVMGAINSLAKR